MSLLLDRLARWGAGAGFVLLILLAALLSHGANSAAAASLLSAVLGSVLILGVLVSPARVLLKVLGDNAVSLLAALLFFAWWGLRIVPGLNASLPAPWFEPPLSPYRAVEGLIAFLACVFAFCLGALNARDANARDVIGKWITLAALFYAFCALFLFYQNGGLGGRLDASLKSANSAATMFGVLAVLSLTLIWRAGRGKLEGGDRAVLPGRLAALEGPARAPLSTAAFVMCLACLLLTASRAGLVVTIASLLAWLAIIAARNVVGRAGRTGILTGALASIVIVFGFLFARGGGAVVERFAFAEDDMLVRRQLAEAHFSRFLEHPWTGSGLGSFHELNLLAATPDNWEALRFAGATHNIFVQALEEGGIIGLALLALMLAPLLARALWRVVRLRPGADWSAAVLALSVLVLLHGLVDFGLQTPAIGAFYAFVLGAFVGRGDDKVRR